MASCRLGNDESHDPVTKVNTPKTFYYEKVGTDVCGVGVYQP
jgi:hypothetical protein